MIIPTASDEEDERTLVRNPFPALVARWQRDAGTRGSALPTTALATVPRSERRLRDTGQDSPPKRVEWYVRLKLRQDLLGKLWARNLMPHDVLVWSQDEQHWLRLEEVPRLRSYVSAVARDWESRERALPARTRSSSEPPPAFTERPGDGRRDVVFRPTGPAARHLASSIPPPSQGAAGLSIPTAPRVPTFDEVLGEALQLEARPAMGREHEQANAGEQGGFAALTQSSVVPPRFAQSTIPPATVDRLPAAEAHAAPASPALRAAANPSAAQHPRVAVLPRSSGVDYVERLVWMVAGVATMFAVMAALGKIRRSDLWQESASVADLVPALGSMLSARLAELPVLRQLSASSAEVSAKLTELSGSKKVDSNQEVAADSESGDTAADDSRHSGGGPRASRRFSRSTGRRLADAGDEKAETAKPSPETADEGEPSKAPTAVERPAAEQASPRGLGSFDRTAARRALAGAAARAAKCAQGAAAGTVVVTYASSGLVQNVTVAELSGTGVSAGCVARSFQSARVTPYFGGSVTVRKSFAVK